MHKEFLMGNEAIALGLPSPPELILYPVTPAHRLLKYWKQ